MTKYGKEYYPYFSERKVKLNVNKNNSFYFDIIDDDTIIGSNVFSFRFINDTFAIIINDTHRINLGTRMDYFDNLLGDENFPLFLEYSKTNIVINESNGTLLLYQLALRSFKSEVTINLKNMCPSKIELFNKNSNQKIYTIRFNHNE